jgi:glycosyltransferase involved in cell wall biosynthesis
MESKKKIAIIGSAGIPAKYGGFETLTEFLTKNLSSEFELTVYCSAKTNDKSISAHNNSKLVYINLDANGMQSIPYDLISIFKAIRFADTLLILGVGGCIILPFLKLFTKKKIIVNIDGLEWKREKWGTLAKKYLKFSEKIAVKNAHFVVADNKVIQEHVANSYNKQSELIAYGGNHAKAEILTEELKVKYPFLNKKYAFKVCRIEPENNIHIILEAFCQFSVMNLVIIGNWNYSDYGKKLFEAYSKFENIFLLDPIYDQNILDQIRSNCFLYVHGHSAGGTNPSLVEAMYLGLPILAFDVNYNVETTNNQAIYFKDTNDLIEKLKNADSIDFGKLKQDMKSYADQNYTWEIIARKYGKLF